MEKYKLSELIVIKNGRDHKDLPNGNYPVFGSGGVMRYVNSYLYDKPSVLLPRKGSLSNIQYSDTPFWTVDTLYYTEINEELVSPYYLYRYLRLLDVSRLDSGTGVPSMTFDSYYNINVFLPNIEEQRRVASILQKLDKKIALNHQINDNLEAMAKQLYDYWFVQFDFPNEEGKPYKSSGGAMVWNEKLHLSIPSNWEAIPLSEIIDYAGGSQPPASEFIEEYRDGYVRFVQIRDYYSNSHITYIPIRKSNKLCAETDIMIARYGASLGRICYGLNGAYNVALAKVSPKVKEYTEYLRIFLMSDGFYNKINSIGQRAAQAGFNKDDIENILIPFPTNNRCIIEFNKKMQPYFFARLQNDKEINTLTKQRDELLPLLMNGQASVNYHLYVYLQLIIYCIFPHVVKINGI